MCVSLVVTGCVCVCVCVCMCVYVQEEERARWVAVLREQRVLLMPGLCCEDHERGWFRICFTSQPIAETLAAIHRAVPALLV